jgi:hypothetical protein
VVWSSDAFNIKWNDQLPDLEATEAYFHRPTHLNKRIIAQESIFLVSPLLKKQMKIDPINLENHDVYGRSEKFVIAGKSKDSLRDSLDDFGLNRLSIYQSIEAAAMSIREEYLMDRVLNISN